MDKLKKRVLKALYNLRKKVEDKEREIENFENNPLSLFNDLQYDRDMIPELLSDVDESVLLEYQNWQYPLIVKEMQLRFNMFPYSLDWEPDVFPSPIYLIRNGYRVAGLQAYTNSFEVLSSPETKKSLDEYTTAAKYRIDKWEELERLKIKQMNPFVNEDDSLMHTIKLSMKRKKITANIEKQLPLLVAELEDAQYKEQKCYLRLEKVLQEENIEQYDLEKIYQQLAQFINLHYVNKHQELLKNTDKEVNEYTLQASIKIEELEQKAMSTEQY